VSTQQNDVIREMGRWSNNVWTWKLNWRRNLFQWEADLVAQLESFINGTPILLVDDSWSCSKGDEGFYAVKAGYNFLSENFLPVVEVSTNVLAVLKNLWSTLAPSKVIVFSWQLMMQRLPTRVNLARRGVPGLRENPCCVWCPEERESEVHLFGTCSVALAVWSEIYKWLGLQVAHPSDLCSSFDSFGFPFNVGKKRKKGLIMIWQAVVWAIWKARNACIFDGKVVAVDELVETIKHVSLRWFLAKRFPSVCCYYEWVKFPLDCLLR
jgi:hypothetical protein